MTAKLYHLTNLSSSRKCEMSTINALRMSSQVICDESGVWVNLGDIPNAKKARWHMAAPIGYLAYLDSQGVRRCTRDYKTDDLSREWVK